MVSTRPTAIPIRGTSNRYWYDRGVQVVPPALAPIFRSDTQLRLLGEIFCGTEPRTASDLARRIGVAQATAWREVERLRIGAIVDVDDGPGGTKLVSPNDQLPYHSELRRIIAHTAGVLPLLRAALADVADIERAVIFGSWANRYHGEPGHFPRDVDLLVVGTIGRFDLADITAPIEAECDLQINPIIVEPGTDLDAMPLLAESRLVEVR